MTIALTPDGRATVADAAQRHGFSPDAAAALLAAVAAGGGTQAQFSHPEFGGMGQWSAGGMIMIGDMFNNGLKARVGALCDEFSRALAGPVALMAAPAAGFGAAAWWPATLGQPSTSGAQNAMRYAFFPAARRLAVDDGRGVTVYDTGDHMIGGVAQAQGGGQSLSFSSQFGPVDLTRLPVVDGVGAPPPPLAPPPFVPTPSVATFDAPPPPVMDGGVPPSAPAAPASGDDVFATLERLARLRDQGVLTEDEFVAKKTELLARI